MRWGGVGQRERYATPDEHTPYVCDIHYSEGVLCIVVMWEQTQHPSLHCAVGLMQRKIACLQQQTWREILADALGIAYIHDWY